MAVSLFKKTPAEAPTPHRDALRSHSRGAQKLFRQRQLVISKIANAKNDVDAAAAGAANVERLRAEIDRLLGDARYAGADLPDVSGLERELLAAEKQATKLSLVGRAAASAASRFTADSERLAQEYREHAKGLPGLLHAAVVEQMQGLASEFRAQEEALRAIHAKVFAHVVLADQLARENGLGVFFGARLFGELNISRPQHDAFHRGSTDVWAAAQERDQSGVEVEQQAEALSRELLKAGD